MTALTYDWHALRVLWLRDLMRFLRQPSRIVGALGQPLIFWVLIGLGMSTTFHLGGAGGAPEVPYLEYLYPGVVAMVLVFASIFASVSVIDDRRQGFLQAVLAGPGSRGALVTGKCLGSTTVALVQVAMLLAFAPWAGFSLGEIHWPLLVGTVVVASFALTCLGFAMAWWLDNLQAYHAIQMTLLIPLWVLSGAMFPPDPSKPIFSALMLANPIAYAVSAIRHALYGGAAPSVAALTDSPGLELGLLTGLAALSWLASITLIHRRR